MPEKAILAIEEALLATLFTQRALVDLLIKKGIICRSDLEHEILKTEHIADGTGKAKSRKYLEKRKPKSGRRKLK